SAPPAAARPTIRLVSTLLPVLPGPLRPSAIEASLGSVRRLPAYSYASTMHQPCHCAKRPTEPHCELQCLQAEDQGQRLQPPATTFNRSTCLGSCLHCQHPGRVFAKCGAQ